MKKAAAFALLLLLMACSAPDCHSQNRDGGIGGTGSCAQGPAQ